VTSFAVEVGTDASAAAVWDVIRDIGALHTRLVPGFVTNSELVPGGRRVTFANGMTVIELIVSLDDNLRRLVWTAQGGASGVTHYNAAVQVFPREIGGTRVVWMADILPSQAAGPIREMMKAGESAMRSALARLTAGSSP